MYIYTEGDTYVNIYILLGLYLYVPLRTEKYRCL